MRLKTRIDSLAGIRYRHSHTMFNAAEFNSDFAALRRELHGIGKQVPEHLLETGRIHEDRISGGIQSLAEFQPFVLRGRSDRIDGCVDQSRAGHPFRRYSEISRDDS